MRTTVALGVLAVAVTGRGEARARVPGAAPETELMGEWRSRMVLRALIAVILGVGPLTMVHIAEAQQAAKVYQIGRLIPGSPIPHLEAAFEQGLRDVGYVIGQHVVIQNRFAQGDVKRLHEFAADLVRLKVDVIFAGGDEADIRTFEARVVTELQRRFQTMARERADALYVVGDNFTLTHAKQIVELAEKARLPGVYAYREFAAAGGLITYGPSIPDMLRRLPTYIDRILKGSSPGDLPIEQPTKFELVINMKTAKSLGLTVPPALLLRANQVIE